MGHRRFRYLAVLLWAPCAGIGCGSSEDGPSEPAADHVRCEGDGPVVDPTPFSRDHSCSKTEDCVLVSDVCPGGVRTTLRNVFAVRSEQESAFMDALAKACTPPCLSSLIPQYDPRLEAACVRGTCSAIKVNDIASVSTCTTDADCIIRPFLCCACGSLEPDDLISVSDDSAYESANCGATCDACPGGTMHDPGVTAYCTNGSCALTAPP